MLRSAVRDQPVSGRRYRLTGLDGPTLARGSTWADAEVLEKAQCSECAFDLVLTNQGWFHSGHPALPHQPTPVPQRNRNGSRW